MRICVIGNSHLAALKLAWDKVSDEFESVQVTFFGSRDFAELIVDDRKLKAKSDHVKEMMSMTSGGLNEIVADDYDIFVLHGLSLAFGNLVRFFLNGEKEVHNQVQQRMDQTLSIQLARKIAFLGKPVLLSPQPFYSEKVLDKEWQNILDADGEPKPYILDLLSAWNKYLDSSPFAVLAQPGQTVTREFLTRMEYSVDAIRLTAGMATKHPNGDNSHMNASYGEAVMRKMVANCMTMQQGMELPKPQENAGIAKSVIPPIKNHPYVSLPDRSFWNRTVTGKSSSEILNWYEKKFDIGSLRIATAGSCFAQHIGRRMRQQGFDYIDFEPAPDSLPVVEHMNHGFGMYSARYGNIYTTRQLRQLIERALGEYSPKVNFWEKDGGYVDPFRPTIQPAPFSSIDELVESREQHLKAVRMMFEQAQVFVFTLGLTETWESIEDGSVFPVAPGVAGGSFSPAKYRFLNLDFNAVLTDMKVFIDKVRGINANMKFILTVSPVPLMATASKNQVIVATTYSKSILRAVAGQLADNRKYVDYFPSFEIINSHVMGNHFYEKDMRSVTDAGVDYVMKNFFLEHTPAGVPGTQLATKAVEEEELFCDEELLSAFGGMNS